MKFTIAEISEIIQPIDKKIGSENIFIDTVFLDTRRLNLQTNISGIFIAIKGKNHNAHDYLQEAEQAGITNFIVSEPIQANQSKTNIWQVEDTTKALQQLAIAHRNKFDIPVIAVTGSNGKTIVKEWLYYLLNHRFNIVRSPKSYNSQIGVALSILRLQTQHNLAIFEAGISEVGEMIKLQKMIRPTIGVFTHLGTAHDSGFKNKEEKFAEKLKLFISSELIVINQKLTKRFKKINLLSVLNISRSFVFISIEKNENNTLIHYQFDKKDDKSTIQIPFTDQASISNAVVCLHFILAYFNNTFQAFEKFASLPKISMRLERTEGINNTQIINDTYNADLDSLRIALDFLKQNATNKRTLILSYLNGLSTNVGFQKEVINLLKSTNLQKIITIGKEWKSMTNVLENITVDYTNFETTEKLLYSHKLLNINNETILIKGERKYDLQVIVKQLSIKKHETILAINLEAIVHNLNHIRTQLNPSTKILAMVKSLAYGLGAYELAKVLEYQKIDYLAVAYVDEGIALRKAGIKLPIIVMNTQFSYFTDCLKYDLEVVIFDICCLKKWINSIDYSPILRLHLKFNTGMNRLGFDINDINELKQILSENKLNIVGVFSHLVASDDDKSKSFTLHQAKLFKTFIQALHLEKTNITKHLLNSYGVFNYPEYQMDMVRLGYGLFGYVKNENLIPCLSLTTFISQIRKVEKGATIGYGNNFVVEKTSYIATLGIGYADGLLRKAGNGNFRVKIKDQFYPTIGNICMDMCMIDLGDKLHNISVTDNVIIFDRTHSITNLANACETINYEIMTNISQRVKRVYWQETI